MFCSYTPPEVYTPPARDPRDDDRAARVYASCHYIGTMFSAKTVGPDGMILDIHPADAVTLDDEDPARWEQDPDARARLPEGSMVMDANTARLITQIADAVNDKNRAMFLGMDLARMGTVAWKLANR